LEHVLRNLGYAVARSNRDVAVKALTAIVRAVAPAVHNLCALIGGREEGIAAPENKFRYARIHIHFDTLAPRLPEIIEKSESRLLGGDKKQVVIIFSVKEIDVPAEFPFSRTPYSNLHRPCHHLLQRWIRH